MPNSPCSKAGKLWGAIHVLELSVGLGWQETLTELTVFFGSFSYPAYSLYFFIDFSSDLPLNKSLIGESPSQVLENLIQNAKLWLSGLLPFCQGHSSTSFLSLKTPFLSTLPNAATSTSQPQASCTSNNGGQCQTPSFCRILSVINDT